MLSPTLDRVVIKPDEAPEMTPGGLVLPDEAREREKPTRGTIIAVGPGRPQDNGPAVKVRLAIGQTVYYQAYAGHTIEEEGETLLVITEGDILCVVETPAPPKP